MSHHGVSRRTVLVGRHAAAFDRASRVALGWLYRMVARRVVTALPPGGRLLDIGTGPGHLLLEVARRRPDARVVGIDPSADMVGHAVRRAAAAGLSARIEVRPAAAEALPFPDATFDVVVSTLSGHHWADTSTSVAEQVRVLRSGGELWAFDLRGASSHAIARALAADPGLALDHPRLSIPVSAVLVSHRAAKRDVSPIREVT